MVKNCFLYLCVFSCFSNGAQAQYVSSDSSSLKRGEELKYRNFSGSVSVYKAYTHHDNVDSLKDDVRRLMDKYFDIHYGCAPMTYVGLSRLLGSTFTDEQLHRQASSFSGGLAGSRTSTCGALTGAVMVLNNYANGDGAKLRKLTREVYDALHEKYGSVNCDAIRKETARGKRCAECVACCLCVANKVIDILHREGDLSLSTMQVTGKAKTVLDVK